MASNSTQKRQLPGPVAMTFCLVSIALMACTAIMLVWMQRKSPDLDVLAVFGFPAMFVTYKLSRWYEMLWLQYRQLCGAVEVYHSLHKEIAGLRKALAEAEHRLGRR